MPELENRAHDAIETVSERASTRGLEVIESITADPPHRRIADYAEKNDVTLIVMGSAGRSAIRRALLGSVAERTLRTARIPVLIVDAGREIEGNGEDS